MPFDQLAGPIEEGSVSEGEKALASLPPVAKDDTPPQREPEVVKTPPRIVEAEGPVIDAEVPAKAAEPEEVSAKPTKPEKPAVVVARDNAPAKDAAIVEPFFGRPPDDPGVKDPALAAQEPKTRLKLF